MVTMEDIAVKVGVSQATVSYVLGGRAASSKVSPQTRERILDTAREMGYRRNQMARAMVTGKSRILGILTAPLLGENSIRILTGAQQAASDNDYLLKVQHFTRATTNDATIAHCLEWRLAGALLLTLDVSLQDTLYAKLSSWGINLVMVDNAHDYPHCLRVKSDDAMGVREIMAHLIGGGHRKLGFLGGHPSIISSEREQIFRAVLSEAGLRIEDTWIRHGSWGNFDLIAQNAEAILGSPLGRPTALVCASDYIAMSVQRVARKQGLRLPEDLSITGFSNSAGSGFADPPITTVDQRFHEMGYAAVKFLVEKAESSESIPATVPALQVPTCLIRRDSTAPPAESPENQ